MSAAFGLQRLNGDKMNLIKIKHKGSKDGWAPVNEADFDSKKHELFEGNRRERGTKRVSLSQMIRQRLM